jgi:hypothetical protein
MIYGHYQVFGVRSEETYLNKNITALTFRGDITGKVIQTKHVTVLIASDNATMEIPMQTIIKINSLSIDEYERNRILWAILQTTLGGILIWIAIFFL